MRNLLPSVIPKSVLKHVRQVLHKHNFCQPHERAPIDLRGFALDLAYGFSICRDTPFLLEVPTNDCRGLRGFAFPCTLDSGHPFITALQVYQETKDTKKVEDHLAYYYEAVQPTTAGELLGLSPKQTKSPFALSPLCYDYPWDGAPRASLHKRRVRFIVEEAVTHGAQNTFQGWHHFGPLHKERIILEAARLIDVYQKIGDFGYRRDDAKDGDIAGVALHWGGGNRILIKRGHHRIAALAAHGHTKVTVRFDAPYVDRDDAPGWPGVCDEGYTLTQALSVFDRIFDGRQPSVCEAWRRCLTI